MNELIGLAALVVLILVGSAVCSGVEAALLTANPLRVHELAGRPQPPRGARSLQQLKSRMGRALAVLVIANNGFNIFGSLMLGGYAAQVFERLGLRGAALPLFSVGLTVLVILLGEILPKALGSRLALPVSLASAAAVSLLLRVMLPLVLLLERLMPAITAENELTTDEEEIRLLARLGSQKGQIEADEAAMIGKVFQLNDLTARDLMLPRVSAPTLPGQAELSAVRDTLVQPGASSWVVLGQEVDEVLGVASREDLLAALVRGEGGSTVAQHSEPVEFVPEMIRADRLLTAFRRRSQAQRVVVDEFGGFVGVIGAEAVLAVLAGWWRRPPGGRSLEAFSP
ncbi:CNNM domain-containing protein [Vulcanococcus limneticus]|uniref:CNNM domain-containing protein n=1 Tax=Vulcanococcus limneticus TaxID=2170428 RepID=UPI00398BDA7D